MFLAELACLDPSVGDIEQRSNKITMLIMLSRFTNAKPTSLYVHSKSFTYIPLIHTGQGHDVGHVISLNIYPSDNPSFLQW